ncbi:hypothetical protein RvY_04397 [Ramazzottius varieornatus]|uniref:7TM GPCR serpentine receptor class x (Srx) domain-containing protein n=1 Tax=Ramazzottius varieornatus TaxID=947166 RepID=A0A1D1URG5_RAMVA|nr:hypothetical protein RvY_04397 [Ramazzottius varieornatus]
MRNRSLNYLLVSDVSINASLFESRTAHVVISSIQALITFFGTAVSLLPFATLPALRTPFNYHRISTLASELLLSTYQTFVVIQAYYGYWPLSIRGCTDVSFMFFY